MYYLNDYREGQKLVGTYLCKSKQILKTKAGKTYYSLILQDKTGTADAKIWELGRGIEDFETMDYIYCEGLVTSFQGNIQMNISRVRRSEEGEYDPADYIPTTDKDIKEMYTKVVAYVNSVKNPYLSQLLKMFFIEDKEFVKEFCRHSAAKSVHHGFVGGLLEHTLSVTKLSAYFADNYKILNKDLLVCAAMFHDIGKLEELSTFPENDYTDEGQLLGHIMIGAMEIAERIKTIDGFPVKLAHEMEHCILAHHGELEYGSPKKPALPEAVALSYADNIDAKMETMRELLANVPEGDTQWQGFNRLFESNIRRSSI